MVVSSAKKLEPLDLMKLYGRLHFEWNLRADTIEWQGPINKLFQSDIPFLTGTSYLNRMTPRNFWKRFEDISKSGDIYKCAYELLLPDNQTCFIEEEGEVVRDEAGFPTKLFGSIRVVQDSELSKNKNLQGYDTMTGFPEKEVLLENLSSLLEQTKDSIIPGGYLCMSIDRLSWIFFAFGLKSTQEIIQAVVEKLRAIIRFNDQIGRTSGCCFGVILRDADEWGVFQAVGRLQTMCQTIEYKTSAGPFRPTISVGGASFRSNIAPLDLMKVAENSLFEMQNMKGVGNFARNDDSTPIQKRPISEDESKRRIIDSMKEEKKKQNA